GNLTFIGSTANIVALGMLERQEGRGVTFMAWFWPGLATSVPSLLVATLLPYVQIPLMLRWMSARGWPRAAGLQTAPRAGCAAAGPWRVLASVGSGPPGAVPRTGGVKAGIRPRGGAGRWPPGAPGRPERFQTPPLRPAPAS